MSTGQQYWADMEPEEYNERMRHINSKPKSDKMSVTKFEKQVFSILGTAFHVKAFGAYKEKTVVLITSHKTYNTVADNYSDAFKSILFQLDTYLQSKSKG